MNLETLNQYDSQRMYEVYDRWAQIAEEAYNSEKVIDNFENVNHIVFAGMGGSGTIGDIFSSILSKSNLYVSVIKGYILPNTLDSNSLVITTSISGNTVETLSVLKSAKERDLQTLSFSSGGKMEDYCLKNKLKYVKISKIHSPRAFLGQYLYSMLKLLNSLLPIDKDEVLESISKLKESSKKISSSNLSNTNPSLELAQWIDGIPLVYYPWGLSAVATRFKNSLQENSKIHVIVEDVVEASHNGVMSWEKSSNVQPILLRGQDDYIKTKERWKILKEYFNEKNIEYKEVLSVKGHILTKIINLIYLLDYSSIYYAIMNETDPSTVSSLDFIKSRL